MPVSRRTFLSTVAAGSALPLLGAPGLGPKFGSETMMTLGAGVAPPSATDEFLGLWRLIGDTGRATGQLPVGRLIDALCCD